MKKLMKQTLLFRGFILLTAMVLMLSASLLPAAAATEKIYTEWVYDQNTQTLTATFPDGDTEIYYRIESNPYLRYDPDYRYKYYNSVRIGGSSYKIYAEKEGGNTLALQGFAEDWIFFAAAEEKAEAEALFTAVDERVTTLSYRKIGKTVYLHYELDHGGSFLQSMEKLTKTSDAVTLTDTLYGLRYAPRYELWLYDDSGMIAVNYGFLFDLMGEVYYLPARGLPEAAITSDGELLPTEDVTVTLYHLPKDPTEDAVNGISSASLGYRYGVENEGGYFGGIIDPNFTVNGDDTPVGLVYVTIALLGIVLPIAPIVLGLCLPHSAKQGYKKRWYLLTALGSVWMLMGVVLLVIMIVVL